MELQISAEHSHEDRTHVRNKLIAFNHAHFSKELSNRYEELNLFVKNEDGETLGGIVGDICWNWLEIHYLILDEQIRGLGYGSKLLLEIEEIARQKSCDFIKLDTLSFQALDFYLKYGYEVYGSINNAGGHTHYYLKKDLKS
ncbi:GNAT family N-acetyltransferase [Paenibacillus polygoni]|uniref:GNAT family N-acetyltransferase n=1 Tax=Paenibacillus polygoni TaxID=3050112 RepID=A0ABY8X2S3_9BACL|nr:GNAT family N-acetyltransferase [Paenibacillus polygoni]WIV19830.1 GNAT family N-acetyltransferase [Paenibacillus polygoni]